MKKLYFSSAKDIITRDQMSADANHQSQVHALSTRWYGRKPAILEIAPQLELYLKAIINIGASISSTAASCRISCFCIFIRPERSPEERDRKKASACTKCIQIRNSEETEQKPSVNACRKLLEYDRKKWGVLLSTQAEKMRSLYTHNGRSSGRNIGSHLFCAHRHRERNKHEQKAHP